jgi:hypothetical protein
MQDDFDSDNYPDPEPLSKEKQWEKDTGVPAHGPI